MTAKPNNILPLASKLSDNDKRQELKTWVQQHQGFLCIFIDAYCIVDTTNQVVDFNLAFSEICGEPHRKILKIGHFCTLLKTEECPNNCPGEQILKTEMPLRLDELNASAKSHVDLQLILSGIPIFSKTGEVIGALLTMRNVTAESILQKKYDERKQDSITDGLTRLFNKVYTEQVLNRLVRSSMRTHQPVSVLFCDIDHFKKINDTHGHGAGDYVLSIVAQMLRGESRTSDTVGRFGGEEFVVVMNNTEEIGVKVFAERFRKRLESTRISFSGAEIPVTISCGTTTFKEAWSGQNLDELTKEVLKRADTALYYAKANGRNQTWSFEDLPKTKSKKKA